MNTANHDADQRQLPEGLARLMRGKVIVLVYELCVAVKCSVAQPASG